MRSSRRAIVAVTSAAVMAWLILAVRTPTQAAPALRQVWAVDDGEKVFQDDLAHPLKSGGPGNSVWDGHTIRLFSARNEIVAFQLILEANSEGAANVNVVVSGLVGSKGGSIPGSHPLPAPNDYLGVGVELFAEHYLDVIQSSYSDPICGGFYSTAEANPHITGWVPDALIPFSAAVGKGGAPFGIAPDRNQGVWVDVYVPRRLPLGLYTGTVTVTVSSTPVAQAPLELTVLDFTLPDENHYKSMLFYSRENVEARHDTGCCTQAMWDVLLDYHRMAHRHRLELIGSGDWEEIDHLGGTLTGEAFTAAHGYAGPGEGIGNSLFSVHTYGWTFGETEAEYRTSSDAWVSWFDANAPDVEYFLYLIDEPGSGMYDWIRTRADWIHNNPGPGHRLPVFITRWPITELVGYVDIWCMQSPWYDPAVVDPAEARGEKAWVYAGNRPQNPMDVMDEYGVALRLKPWVAYKCDVGRWFTWETTHWFANQNEVPNDVYKNVFVNPVTFDCGGPGGYGNGDGTMFYPGRDYVFTDQDRQFPGPMSSIRMKMYRRGVQDYEYMWMAGQKGHGTEVQTILNQALPHVMWDAVTVPDWSTNNADYESARQELAALAADPGITGLGLYGQATGTFYLRNTNSPGAAHLTFRFGPPAASWTPLAGDWDADGDDTIGLYCPSSSTFYPRDANLPGAADHTFRFGPAASGWVPIIGDWDGDGVDTVGLYSPSAGVFYLRNANAAGPADLTFRFGPSASTWTPVAADWDGDGVDTIGLYCPSTGTFYLRNTNSAGPAHYTFRFGPAASGWKPMAGDWNEDGTDSIGLYSAASGTAYLRNSNSAGIADVTFRYGPAPSTWQPVAGDWDGI